MNKTIFFSISASDFVDASTKFEYTGAKIFNQNLILSDALRSKMKSQNCLQPLLGARFNPQTPLFAGRTVQGRLAA